MPTTPALESLQNRSVRRRRFWLWYILYLAALSCAAWAGFWWWTAGVLPTSVDETELIWRLTFPELRGSGVERAEIGPADGHVDVLLLGGSVLDQSSGAIRDALESRSSLPVRVFNLARSAHTSRDSLYKAQRLREKPFEAVVIYHGINDVRMNCCLPEIYRDDYLHCTRYEQFERKLRTGQAVLRDLREFPDQGRLISGGIPRAEERSYGAVIKTGHAFRSNLEEIVADCQARKKPVVLATFAWYLPANYSRERLERGELDYGQGLYRTPVELWGDPANVTATLEVHNRAIRELAARYDNVLFVDLAERIPRNGAYFSDICHLTEAGATLLAEEIATVLARRLDRH